MPKCPKCDDTFHRLNMQEVDLVAFGAPTRIGLVLCCPSCDVALSASIDPLALKADTVNDVVRRLARS